MDSDALWIAELRALVLRPDLERLGRFDPVLVRQRILSAFDPVVTQVAAGLLPGSAVDSFAQKVCVTEMTGVFLDQVVVEPAQRIRVRLAEGVAEM